jgi:hypothetical protein
MAQRTTCHIVTEQADTLSTVTTDSLRITTNYNRMCPDVVVPAPNLVIGASTTSHRHETQSTAWLIKARCSIWLYCLLIGRDLRHSLQQSDPSLHSPTAFRNTERDFLTRPCGVNMSAQVGSTVLLSWPLDGSQQQASVAVPQERLLSGRYGRIAVCAWHGYLRGVQKFLKEESCNFFFLLLWITVSSFLKFCYLLVTWWWPGDRGRNMLSPCHLK